MDRKTFLGNLFMIAALASLPKQLKEEFIEDKPGISGTPFELKFKREWFKNGDIIKMGRVDKNGYLRKFDYYFRKVDETTADLIPITNNGFCDNTIITIHIAETTDLAYINIVEQGAKKLCSVYEEQNTSDRPFQGSKTGELRETHQELAGNFRRL